MIKNGKSNEVLESRISVSAVEIHVQARDGKNYGGTRAEVSVQIKRALRVRIARMIRQCRACELLARHEGGFLAAAAIARASDCIGGYKEGAEQGYDGWSNIT